jgi:hypothetical protein
MPALFDFEELSEENPHSSTHGHDDDHGHGHGHNEYPEHELDEQDQ